MTSASKRGRKLTRRRRGRLRHATGSLALLGLVLVALLGVSMPRVGGAQTAIRVYVFASTDIQDVQVSCEQYYGCSLSSDDGSGRAPSRRARA